MSHIHPPHPRGCLRIAGIALLSACGLLALAAYFLLGDAPVPAATPSPIDIAQVRRLAVAGGQPLPERINVLMVAEGAFPSALVVPGSGWQQRAMALPVFQIVAQDHTIFVDTAQTQEMHAQMFGMFGSAPFSAEAYDQMQNALRESSLILLTHEHFDHVGGLAHSPYLEEIQPRVRLNRAQLENIGPDSGFPEAVVAGFTLLEYSGYAQAAPGVVLIEMPGHSPGSQAIYVQLQNGAEYLLVGDVLWSTLGMQRQASRPRLMSLMLGEPRERIGQQIRALIDLAAAEPQLHLVISHDKAQIEQYIQDGLLGSQLE